MNRIKGTYLLLRTTFNDSLVNTYEWSNYIKELIVPDSGDLIVQGIWDKYPGVPPAVRQLELVLNHTPPKAGDNILDIGCGLGGLANYCLKKYPHIGTITGIDLNGAHVSYANKVNAVRDKAFFFHENAESFASASNPILAKIISRKFDKIYIVEVTQDLTVQSFSRIFEQCLEVLRTNGTISLFTLTIDKPFKNLIEKYIMNMLVRLKAPNLSQIKGVISKYNCDVVYKDVTDESTAKMAERLLEDKSVVRKILLWPFSSFFLYCVKVGLSFLKNGGYSCTIIHIRKKAM
jgi:SAM-dependent methyltransferase